MPAAPRDVFWQVHSDNPREGPGSDESTARAFALLGTLPARPRILDIGCGPGAQTLCLAGLCDGTITAIDTHRPFLDRLDQEIERRGLSARVTVREANMADLPFRDGAFDVIWAEGSLCFLGVERALRAWRRLLADGGALAFTEVSWLKPDVPAEVRDYGKV